MKPSTPGVAGRPASTQPAAAAKPSANFDDLWSLSLGSSAGATKPGGTGPAANPKSIKDLEKEKALAGLWGGAGAGDSSLVNTRGGSSASRHGGFGSFGGAGGTSSSSNMGGGDDLLL